MTATRPVPEQVSDPRGVRRRYAGRNMATAGGVVHAADMRASMGELLERPACHQPLDGTPKPTDAPITCRRTQCRAAAETQAGRPPALTPVGHTIPLLAVPAGQPRLRVVEDDEHA